MGLFMQHHSFSICLDGKVLAHTYAQLDLPLGPSRKEINPIVLEPLLSSSLSWLCFFSCHTAVRGTSNPCGDQERSIAGCHGCSRLRLHFDSSSSPCHYKTSPQHDDACKHHHRRGCELHRRGTCSSSAICQKWTPFHSPKHLKKVKEQRVEAQGLSFELHVWPEGGENVFKAAKYLNLNTRLASKM